ncbi:dynein axonemal intermediate chain 3 isoform X2 [Archocentrus centrarchus]|uniref:dynein axonemal intermediate chain 3 isoform X2 n=1 Tax=Archocentrus centrarchus TaxID=63155 RepID=UPI0011E9CE9C|nr:WD repeat-containing protein 63 isoform X2 [Archocentrus centrarchus]XP_030583006.1 WD repeat-containing protein 63 isoform X2 [Archocentrus centrarchus]
MAPKREKSASRKAGGKGKGKKSQPTSAKEKPDHPDDIYPIVLTTATQERFECCVNEDVTEERPYKLLKKDEIIQDIKMRAAVSDFSPVKQIVLDYIEEEMLLVFDIKFTYGQSFYLVLTPEAKARIYKPPQPEIIEVFEDDLSKTPEPKPWISLGSELEIDEESVKETREKLCSKFSKVRRTFGAPVCFSDRSAADAKDSLLRFASYQDSRFSIKLMQRDCRTQAVPRLQNSSAQTQCKFHRDVFTQYEPRDLSEEEIESILSSENLKTFCNSVIPRVLHALQQEIIMNIFTDDFKVLGTGGEAADRLVKVSEGLVLHQAFTDQKHTKGKKISSVNWHPTIPGLIAVALTKKREKQLDESTTHIISPAFIVFYSFSDPANPQLLLECPDDIAAFEFCPSNPDIIVGGCMNGQVVLWDISVRILLLQGTQPNNKQGSGNTDTFDLDDIKENKTPVLRYCAVSAVESSHKSPVTDVQWLPRTFEVTRTGLPVENKCNISVQVVTCSPDCTVMFWDLRVPKLQSQPLADRKQNVDQKTPTTAYSVPETFKHLHRTWKPLFRVSLPKIDTSGEYAPLKFSLEHYTCNGNTGRNTDSEGDGNAVIPDYSQLRIPSAKTLSTLEDVNTKFYIGTEDGEVVYTDWKLEKDESGRLFSGKPLLCFGTHHWSVNTIQRSPFFKDVVLTTGGWNFAIWKEDVMDGPIFVTPSSEQECTVGCWSLSRPAVFFIGKADGSIEMWNLLLNTSEPTQVYAHITNTKITCIKPWITSPKQHYLAVTDNLGMLRVLNIPKTLYSPSTNEDLKVQKYFEREKDRLKDFLERGELWAKQKKEAEEKKKVESDKPVKFQEDSEEENMKAYNEYLILEENTLKVMGLWPHAANTQDT